MPTHNLHSRMDNYFQRREEVRMNRGPCGTSSRLGTNTLQSVLQGDIPNEYLHLTSFEQRPSYTSNINSGERQLSQSRHYPARVRYDDNDVTSAHRNIEMESHDVIHRHGSSPCSQRRMSPYSRPTHGVHPGYRHHDDLSPGDQQYYDRRSPGYHNRSSPFYDPGSPYSRQGPSPLYAHQPSPVRPHSPNPLSNSPLLAPNSPVSAQSPYHSSDEVFVRDEQPIDLSCKTEKSPSDFVFSRLAEAQDSQSSGSLLRNLLSSGKQSSSSGNSDRDSPCSDVMKPEVPITGTTPVTLAKKMIHPITSRVSDWLVKIVQFSKSIPEFSNMSSNDKLTLLAKSWARILILFMAENEFEFAVTPLRSQQGPSVESSNVEECPTMKSVETIQSFIRKCKNMNLDQKEYALLRMSVLFNTGHVGLDNPDMVEKLNAAVQQLLQQHVSSTRPEDTMHYSRILMSLPTLYGINSKMIENLFCHGIHPNMDIDILLLEMLRNL